MEETNTNQWWQITCDVTGLNDDTLQNLSLDFVSDIEQGGTAQESENTLTIFLHCSKETCEQRLAELQKTYSLGAVVSAVADRNWVAESQESWQAVTAGALCVTPFLETSHDSPPAKGEIRIHPGTGFGTGHHATTNMLLQLLQSEIFCAAPPKSVLDVGTGSGVLAIAANQLFETPIDAFDTDPMAIENATLNTRLNHCSDEIKLHTGTIDFYTGTYDLVIANLYAELLIELRKKIVERTFRGSNILVSGILLTLWPSVETAFSKAGCRLITRKVSSEEFEVEDTAPVWVAAHFEQDRE